VTDRISSSGVSSLASVASACLIFSVSWACETLPGASGLSTGISMRS
jgi:hypothetical protein